MAQQGDLFLIGGAENRNDAPTILWQFVQSSGAGEAAIGLITAATEAPAVALRSYSSVFKRLGVRRIYHLPSDSREKADQQGRINNLAKCTGVLLVGGAQHRLVRTLRKTRMWEQLLHRHQRAGVALAGTSAGASALGESMIAYMKPRDYGDDPVIQPGLNAISHTLIDQHFFERNRLHRLEQVMKNFPLWTGIGIDENTAVWIRHESARAIGSGHVTLIKNGNIHRFSNGHQLE